MVYNDGIHHSYKYGYNIWERGIGVNKYTPDGNASTYPTCCIYRALIFGRVANRIGARRSVMVSLVLWSAVVIYGYFIHTATEFFILGITVGFVLGGTQALSRSFYGAMIPENASAEFYGFYSVFSKFSAILGPFTFGISVRLQNCSVGDYILNGILYPWINSSRFCQ